MIDPRELQSLAAVAREGSVTAAAEVLGFTPSAVSQQVKRLESALQVSLLERVGRGVALTAAGRLLVDEAEPLLSELEAVAARAGRTEGSVRGTVRIAAFCTAIRGPVAPGLAELATLHPGLHCRLTEVDPWEATEQVASGRTDVALVHTWASMPSHFPDSLRVETVGTDVADLVVGPGDPLTGRECVTPADLVGREWVSVAEGSICFEWLKTMFATVEASPVVRYRSPEFATHLALVSAGLAIALIPRLGRGPLPDGCRAVRVVQPVPARQVHVVTRHSQSGHPAVDAVRSHLGALDWGERPHR